MTKLELTYWNCNASATFTTELPKKGYTLKIDAFTGVFIKEKEGEK